MTDETRLDLRTMAEQGPGGKLLVGGRRHLGVGVDRVLVSRLAHPGTAGTGIDIPVVSMAIHCKPLGYDEYMSPVDHDGWLDVAALTSWRQYWLELSPTGGILIERSDSDGTSYRWHWRLPPELWEGIR